MPAPKSFKYEKGEILSLIAVIFLTISLVGVTIATNTGPQLIGSFAKVRKNIEDIGSGRARHAAKVEEENARERAKEQAPAPESTQEQPVTEVSTVKEKTDEGFTTHTTTYTRDAATNDVVNADTISTTKETSTVKEKTDEGFVTHTTTTERDAATNDIVTANTVSTTNETSTVKEKTDEGFVSHTTTITRDVQTGAVVDAQTKNTSSKTTSQFIDTDSGTVRIDTTITTDLDTGQYYTYTAPAVLVTGGASATQPTRQAGQTDDETLNTIAMSNDYGAYFNPFEGAADNPRYQNPDGSFNLDKFNSDYLTSAAEYLGASALIIGGGALLPELAAAQSVTQTSGLGGGLSYLLSGGAGTALAGLNLADDLATVGNCALTGNNCDLASFVVSNPIPGAGLADDLSDFSSSLATRIKNAAKEAGILDVFSGNLYAVNPAMRPFINADVAPTSLSEEVAGQHYFDPFGEPGRFQQIGGGTFSKTYRDMETNQLVKIFKGDKPDDINQLNLYKNYGGKAPLLSFGGEMISPYGDNVIGFSQDYIENAVQLKDYVKSGGRFTQAQIDEAVEALRQTQVVTGQAHGDLFREPNKGFFGEFGWLHPENTLVQTTETGGIRIVPIDYGGFSDFASHILDSNGVYLSNQDPDFMQWELDAFRQGLETFRSP